MVVIPAGPFLFGPHAERRETQAFAIDRHPVTIAEYAEFAQKHSLRVPQFLQQSSVVKTKGDHPMVGITWREALAFCRLQQCDLPTEEEWEKAARGDGGLLYPFGNRFDSKCCNTKAAGRADTTPVDYYKNGASPYGVMDLAGNVFEFTNSVTPTLLVRVKGGSWFDPPALARADRAMTARLDYSSSSMGFRRVRRPGGRLVDQADGILARASALNATAPPLPAGDDAMGDARLANDIKDLFAITTSESAAHLITAVEEQNHDIVGGLTPETIARALAEALEVPPETARPVEEALAEALARGDLAGTRAILSQQSGVTGAKPEVARVLADAEEALAAANRRGTLEEYRIVRRGSTARIWLATALALALANALVYWARSGGRL